MLLGTATTTWGWRKAIESRQEAVRQKQLVEDTLRKNRELLIQRALTKAFEAKLNEVDDIAAEYTNILGDEDHWPEILRATAHWHAGGIRCRN